MQMRAGPFSAHSGEGKCLFSDASLSLNGGELVVLEGPSGSGKSSLLRQLVGLDPAEHAERSLDGAVLGGPRLPQWRARVTLLAQDAPILPGTIRSNLEIGFRLAAGRTRQPDPGLRDQLMKAVDLGSLPEDRDAASLSGGERHRLALVRGLLWDPPVLVADEPLSGLDPERAEICFRLLRDQAARPDRAVLCVLHDPSRRDMADRRLLLGPSGLEELP